MRAVWPVAAFSLFVLAACDAPQRGAPEADSTALTPAPAASPAISPAPMTGDWGSLTGLVGQYPRDSRLIEASVITPALKALLGDRFQVFQANMQTQGPLQSEGAVLFTSGNKPHQGGIDAAYLLIEPTSRALEVGLWEGGNLTTYKTPGADIAKPADIRTMIDNAAP